MNNTEAGRYVMIATACLMGGFGVLVAVWSVIAKLRGRPAWPIWRRYLAWFVITPPLVLPLAYSKVGYQVVVFVLSSLCFREYSRATGLWKDKKLVIACHVAIAAIYYPVFVEWYGFYQAMPAFAMAFVLMIPVIRDEYEHMIQKVCLAILGVLYFGWFLSHVAFLRNVEHSVAYIFFLLVIVESNDAFGYLWGSLIGRRKLVPQISPNKTREGMIGAVVSVLGLAVLLRVLVPQISTPHLLVLTFVLAVFGVCGDLMMSYIKRDLRIKDTGSVIPGHGGLLDRFDSLLLTAPMFFHFLRYHYGHLSHGW